MVFCDVGSASASDDDVEIDLKKGTVVAPAGNDGAAIGIRQQVLLQQACWSSTSVGRVDLSP